MAVDKRRMYSKVVALTFKEGIVDDKPYVFFGASYGKWVISGERGWRFVYDDSVPPAPTLEELCINYLVFWDPIANGGRGL